MEHGAPVLRPEAERPHGVETGRLALAVLVQGPGQHMLAFHARPKTVRDSRPRECISEVSPVVKIEESGLELVVAARVGERVLEVIGVCVGVLGFATSAETGESVTQADRVLGYCLHVERSPPQPYGVRIPSSPQ